MSHVFHLAKKNSTTVANSTTEAIKNERLLLVSAAAQDGTYNFSFTAGRLVKAVTWNNGATIKSFSYAGNTVTAITTENGKKTAENIYTLSNGIAQKQTTAYFDANGNSTDQYTTSFNYNAAGLLEKTIYLKNGASNGYAQYNYDSNKDLTEFSYYNGSGTLQSRSMYEYNFLIADKAATFGRYNTSGDNYLFPRLSKHLCTKRTAFSPVTNITSIYTYTYTTDALGYEIKQVVKDANGTVIEEITNTWE